MSFLKKLGQVVANVAGIVSGIGPFFGAAIPGASGTITKITSEIQQLAGVIATVEAIGQAVSTPLPGTEKLKAATPLVAQVILSSSVMVGKKIADPAKFQAGCAQLASGMADILNSLSDNQVTVTQPQDVKA